MKLFLSTIFLFATFLSFASNNVVLQFWCMPNGPSSQSALEKNLQDFTKETKISVKLKIVDWSEAFLKIKNSFESENTPDIIQLGTSWVSFFSSKGNLADLSHLANSIDTSRFIPTALYNSKVEGLAGLYAIPWFLDVRALFVNKSIHDSLKISDSSISNISAFLGTLEHVASSHMKNASGLSVIPFGIPGKNDWTGHQQMAPFIWNEGGDYIKKTKYGWKSALLEKETLLGIAEYVKILKDSTIAPFSLRDNSSQLTNRFANGEQAFLFGTSEIIRKLDLSISEYGLKSNEIGETGIYIYPFPAGSKGQFTFVGGSLLAISSKCKHSEEAALLLRYLLRPNNLDLYTKRIGFLPPDKSLLRVWERDSRYQKLILSLNEARTFPNISQWAAIENDLIDMANAIGTLYRSPILKNEERITKLAILLSRYDQKINQKLNNQFKPKHLSSIIEVLETEIKTTPFIPQKKKISKKISEEKESSSHIFNIILLIFIVASLFIIFISRKRYSTAIQHLKKRNHL